MSHNEGGWGETQRTTHGEGGWDGQWGGACVQKSPSNELSLVEHEWTEGQIASGPGYEGRCVAVQRQVFLLRDGRRIETPWKEVKEHDVRPEPFVDVSFQKEG